MKIKLLAVLLSLMLTICIGKAQTSNLNCNDKQCAGSYEGPEFIDGSDVAHQFSNEMASEVGVKQKHFIKKVNTEKLTFRTLQ